MSDSRVLVIDTNPEQGRSVAAVLEFVDFTPECWTDVEALCAQKTRPREYAAIVIGGLGEQGDAFYKWLKRDPQFPFVLLLPEQVDAHHGLHPDEHAVLQMPIRHQQLSELFPLLMSALGSLQPASGTLLINRTLEGHYWNLYRLGACLPIVDLLAEHIERWRSEVGDRRP